MRYDEANLHQPDKRLFTYYFPSVLPWYRFGEPEYFNAEGSYTYDPADARRLLLPEEAALHRAFGLVADITNFLAAPGTGVDADIVAYGLTQDLARTTLDYMLGARIHAFANVPRGIGPEDSDITFLPPAVSGTDSGHVELVALHELGHALGLMHPDEAGLPNDSSYTIMSNRPHPGELRDVTELQLYDVAALQLLYGRDDTFNSGTTRYHQFLETTGTFAGRSRMFAIWDGGGIDTIDASGTPKAALIDLRPGFFSSIGSDTLVDVRSGATPTLANAGRLNISIAFGAYIENAIGTAQNDLIIGNIMTNRLEGGAGNDVIYGEDEDGSAPGIHDSGHEVDYRQVSETGESTFPGPGADSFVTDPALQSDTLLGGDGDDYLQGSRGNDVLDGGADSDRLHGGAGNDLLIGSDTSEGGGEQLFGEDGSDRLISSSSNGMLLDGGAGSDYLEAVSQSIRVVFRGGRGNDVLDPSRAWQAVTVEFRSGDGHDVVIAGVGDEGEPRYNINLIDLSSLARADVTLVWQATLKSRTNGVPGEGPNVDQLDGDLVIRINATGDTLLIPDVRGEHRYEGNLLTYTAGFSAWDGVTVLMPSMRFSDGGGQIGASIALQIGNVEAYDIAQAEFQAANTPSPASTSGTGAADNLHGGNAQDTITAGAGDDVVTASPGNDIVDGGADNDTIIFAGRRFDFTFVQEAGGVVVAIDRSGVDGWTRLTSIETVKFARGEETFAMAQVLAMYGTEGNDPAITGTEVGDRLYGLGGDDVISGLAGDDIIDGGAGDDTMFGGAGGDRIDGGSGDDTIGVSSGIDFIDGGAGQDTLTVDYGASQTGVLIEESRLVFGVDPGPDGGTQGEFSNGVDTSVDFRSIETFDVTTGSGNDLIDTGAGNDRIVLGAGNDTAKGGAGNDVIDGGSGDDTLFGGDGNDDLDGGPGNDRIEGGAGDDTIRVSSGVDFIFGGAGQDTLVVDYGTSQSGILIEESRLVFGADPGPDGGTQGEYSNWVDASVDFRSIETFDVTTGSGNDLIYTGSGNDRIVLGAGNDAAHGGAGNDVIDGGAGNDVIQGASGADRLTGGTGYDMFRYMSVADSISTSRDQLSAFVSGEDRIDLSAIDADSVSSTGNDAFVFLGSNAFTSTAGQLRVAQSGSGWLVEGDVDGDGAADLSILVEAPLAPVASDFLL